VSEQETMSADDDTLELLNEQRDLARLRLLGVRSERERLEVEHDELVAKVAVLDHRIEAVRDGPVTSREEARRFIEHAKDSLAEGGGRR